nr:uncharacterized protein CTRU02_07633 [Colletotrichum truncatum]KAF6791293.1 integral membrane protein [Colletotrichum truncatum]
MMFLKLSTALGLLRLGTSRWYRWSLWATMVSTNVGVLGQKHRSEACLYTSGPFHKARRTQYMWVLFNFTLFVILLTPRSAFNIFTDVILAMLPVPIVWNLQMKLKTRLYFIGILSLGYLAVAMGIIKAVYQIAFGSDMDKTFNYSIFCLGISSNTGWDDCSLRAHSKTASEKDSKPHLA